jgi:hypothetical protein
MASRYILDLLAKRIRRGITKSEFLPFLERDLEGLWGGNGKMSVQEKSVLIKNFATIYGFRVLVDLSDMSANFYVLSETKRWQGSELREKSSLLL